MSGPAQGYIGRNPGDSQVHIARQQFTPTGVTTDFTFTSGYTAGYVDVYINGAKILVGRDYTATNGSEVGLTSAAQNGEIVEIVAYKAFNVNNVSESAGNFTVGGVLTVDDNTSLSGQLEVTGVSTFAGAVENVVSTGIVTALGISGNITGAAATFSGAGSFGGNLDVTGNVTIGGTLTYEDVTNIDSIGIVTARSGIVVSGGEVSVGAAFSVSQAGVVTATSYYGDGSNLSNITSTTINNNADNRLITGSGTANTLNGESTLTYNGSTLALTGDQTISSQLTIGTGITMGSAGVATFSGTADIHLRDNVRLNVGDGNDFYIQSGGTGAKLHANNGVLELEGDSVQIWNAAANEAMAKFTADSSTELYFNNSKKIETTNDGAKITGSLATGGTAGALLSHAGSTSIYESQTAGDSLIFKTTPSGGSSTQALAINSVGDVELSGTAAGVKSCFWDASANTLIFNDASKAAFGDSSDLSIYHDGSHSYIDDSGTGSLYLKSNQFMAIGANGETMIQATEDAGVYLRYNNSVKFETTNDGTTTTGVSTATGLSALGAGTLGIEARSTSTQNTDTNKALKVKNNSDTNTFSVSYKGEVFVGPYDGGFLGIGTDNPQTQLHITAAGPVLTHDATNGSSGLRINSQQYQTAGQLLRVQNAGITTFVIQRNGFTGINTNTVQRGPLHVHNNGTGDCQIHMTNDETGPTGNDGFTIFTGGNAGPNAGFVNRETGGDIQVYTHNGSSVGLRLTIEDEGNLVSTAEIHDSKGELRALPQLSKSSNYVIVGADAGKHVKHTGTGGWTINTTTAFSIGEMITVVNASGSAQTLFQAAGVTLYDTRDGATGDHSISARGMATALCTASNEYYVSGNIA